MDRSMGSPTPVAAAGSGHGARGLKQGDPDQRASRRKRLALGRGSPHISHYPFIVLAAKNSPALRRLRSTALEHGIACTDFVATMRIGTTAEQLAATAATVEEDHEYLGVCLFGKTSQLRELTKRFSLFTD